MTLVPHLLVVDDQDAVRDICQSLARQLGYDVSSVSTGAAALSILDQRPVDILLTDVGLPDMSGLDLLEQVKQRAPTLPVLLMTAHAAVGTAVQAMKLGATDYITKPFEAEEMRLLLAACGRRLQLESENRFLREQLKSRSGFGPLIGAAPQMQRIYHLIAKVAQNRYPALVLGENGTGKEVVARALHYQGPNRDRPFIPVDCTGLVPSLIESELFGYVKGAFTGAVRNREGLLEVAGGGTVFLDEIAELPVDLQAKLLRAIQEKEIRPVGGTRRVHIECRIVAATNHDLATAVSDGTFRKDLFFRLNVVSIKLPPLRQRAADIPMLVDHFLEKHARPVPTGRERTAPRHFDEAALLKLMQYEWPGNVRELENCVERAIALSSGPQMTVDDLPTNLRHAAATLTGGLESAIRPLLELEREAIYNALNFTRGDRKTAAALLGIGKTTLYRKLKEFKLQASAPPAFPPRLTPAARAAAQSERR